MGLGEGGLRERVACGECGWCLELAGDECDERLAPVRLQRFGFLERPAQGILLLPPLQLLPPSLRICSFRFFLCSSERFLLPLLQLLCATVSFLLGFSESFLEFIIMIAMIDCSRFTLLWSSRLR